MSVPHPRRVGRASRPGLASALLLLPALFCGPMPARAQAVPPSTFAALRWRNIGPFRAGRVLAVAGIPGDPRTFFFGAVDGGVWKSVNAGLTWEPITDGQTSPSIGAIAVAPSNPNVIYVGTGEADMRSDMTYGDGVYRTTDGGAHWQHLGLDDTRHIGKVLVDPRDPDIALVAALGHAYGPNRQRGVFRTTDGGRTWHKVLYRDSLTGAVDMAWDPSDPQVVFASLWQARRPPWSQYPPDEGPGSGLYRSADSGQTWSAVSGHGLPTGPLGRIGVAVARGSHGHIVYALIEAQGSGSGLYRSDDGGASWSLASTDPRITTRMWYFSRVYLDPRNSDIVYVPNRSILRSTDGGHSFTAIKGSPGGDDYHTLWIDPQNSDRMIQGADQGASVSLDDGHTWSSWYNQPTAQFYHVAVDDRFPYRVYGAQQDAGTVDIASRSDYGEITFRDWHPVGAGEAGYIAPDPANPDIIYGGDTYGALFRFDDVTGQAQDIAPWPLSAFGQPMPGRVLRFTWTSPLVFDPHDPQTLYFGAQVLLRSRDGGLHFDSISPDLTGARPAEQARGTAPSLGDAAAEGWGVIYTVAPSPVQPGVIWAGTDDGLIQRTSDGGGHWQDVTPRGLPPWSKISLIEASPFDAASAYAAVDRHRLDDLNPYIYRTRDGGQHWNRADTGIPGGSFVRAVRADPNRKGLLFAGTERGVYVSFDDGDAWQPLQLNLPMVAVRDLAIHDHDLIAATHGRAFWILDDITPLEQLSPAVLAADANLFQPETAIRIRRNIGNDTPLPPEIPHGENPPAGAIIDYWLKAAPSGPVTLDIVDATGRTVRHFSSQDRPPAPPGEPPYFMDAWLPQFRSLSTHAGHNRFLWDLRYPTPPAAVYDYSIAAIAGHGTVAEPQGPLVPPGDYRVHLTVQGTTYTQPLHVRMDPRVHVTDTALADQLHLALEIWNAMAEEHAVHQAADDVAGQLHDLAAKQLDSGTAARLSALEDAVDDVARGTTGAELGALATSVQRADREPTRQSRDAFHLLAKRLGDLQQRWQTIVAQDIASLNARLEKQGASPIHPPTLNPEHIS